MSNQSTDTPLRQRGRPRTFDRGAALDAAVSLFWRHGYEGTSIADLTAAMGVTPPTLYAAFGSKEELYRAVLARYLDREASARVETFQREPSAYRAIEFYLRDIAKEFANPSKPAGCMIAASVRQCADENKPAAEAVASCRAVSLQIFQQKFEEAQRGGQLPAATDPAALARFYVAIIQGMSVQAGDGACFESLNGVVDLALASWPGARLTQSEARF